MSRSAREWPVDLVANQRGGNPHQALSGKQELGRSQKVESLLSFVSFASSSRYIHNCHHQSHFTSTKTVSYLVIMTYEVGKILQKLYSKMLALFSDSIAVPL